MHGVDLSWKGSATYVSPRNHADSNVMMMASTSSSAPYPASRYQATSSLRTLCTVAVEHPTRSAVSRVVRQQRRNEHLRYTQRVPAQLRALHPHSPTHRGADAPSANPGGACG